MVERDLSFTINPEAVRKGLKPFLDENPELWLYHAVQLGFDLGPLIAIRIGVVNSGWTITLDGLSDTQLVAFAAETVKAASPLDSSLASRMARILLELELSFPNVEYRCREVVEISFSRRMARFQHKQLAFNFGSSNSDTTFLIPGQLSLFDGSSLQAIWTKPWVKPGQGVSDDSLLGYWCDYETVEMDEQGFPWRISQAGTPYESASPASDETAIFYHPISNQSRGFCSQVIFGDYPEVIHRNLGLSGQRDFHTWRIRRVLGVFWGVLQRFPAQVRPVIRGYLAPPIFVPELPEGFQVYSDASHLSTDLSGIKLVKDEAYRNWLRENIVWGKSKLPAYLRIFDDVRRHLWMQTTETLDLGSTVSTQKTKSFSVFKAMHRIAGEDRIRRKRKKTLEDWT